MPSQTSTPSLLAKGVVGCNVSVTPLPFTSDEVNLLDTGKRYQIFATTKSRDRAVLFYIKKNIVPGTYSIGAPDSDEDVGAYIFHAYPDSQYNHYAKTGTFNLNSIDFANTEIDATFEFDTDGRPGEPTIKVTNGTVTLSGP
ncbi:hypothetical protein LVW35_22415 [Pseudomonas sp. HN11]|uniref:hypothetical protein n=1 Tax=Pseudomonas sp. HN11 TaxID=1344094 RepID=UPI001F407D28|nr:hypothetical protein [Pseudomonas sp. HN11]UII70386.1 hypothetical protein LVW35_22415 [Pseudomonas sp. HN11]